MSDQPKPQDDAPQDKPKPLMMDTVHHDLVHFSRGDKSLSGERRPRGDAEPQKD